MRIIELNQLMINNLSALQQRRNNFYQVGDVATCMAIDEEISETELIIKKLTREE